MQGTCLADFDDTDSTLVERFARLLSGKGQELR